ncbi:ABC transporter ATP-binding protein [Mucilaginibacter mali]|uniref:ABC transporter ATP-binding protein n=1 Tax=Mucilaginibacter mali TaxID=2740462 RepID=A0A7D4QEV3_9SPHI|nr:ABC transporter ATP-binding protein [Mucilaginibacter mali]QKJ29912.1 ABC transporter ATP-binding protein [Mucilaginibacter mali]
MAGLDLLMSLADVAFLAALLFIIRVYTGGNTVGSSFANYAELIIQKPVMLTGAFLVLYTFKNIAGVWILKCQHNYVFRVSSRLSEKNINNYFNGSYADYVHTDSSIRARHISNVPIEFSSYVLTNLQQIIAQGMLIIFTVSAILLYHPVLFVLLLLLLLPPVILLGWFSRGQLKKVRVQIKQSSAKALQYLHESLAGYVEGNVYHASGFFIKRYLQHQQQLNQNIATQQTLQGSSSRFIEVFALLGFFILVVINSYFSGRDTIDVLTIGVFMAAAYKIIPGAVRILNSVTQMKTYSFILDDLANEALPKENVTTSGRSSGINNIRFDNISFKFKDHNVVDNLSFGLQPGDIAGISGVSGRGKTTIINLLLGFLQQDSGLIFINNEISDIAYRKTYWQRIAYVKQQAFFINDTILKNITLTEDGFDKARLDKALQISGLDVLLNTFPEGIDKLIKEHGKNISGGQRQRVALARALYHDHDLLILDEPFSELDEDAEREILTRLGSDNTKGIMVLLITHNKASLCFCNKIILA